MLSRGARSRRQVGRLGRWGLAQPLPTNQAKVYEMLKFSALVGVLGVLLTAAACRKPTATTHVARGDGYFASAKYGEAIVEYRAALQADPKLGHARLKLGDAYIQAGNLRQALAEYVRAADLMPNSFEAQLKAGNMLVTARQFED